MVDFVDVYESFEKNANPWKNKRNFKGSYMQRWQRLTIKYESDINVYNFKIW